MPLTDWMQSGMARRWHSLHVIIAAAAKKKQHISVSKVLSVAEVPDAGQHHRDPKPVRRFNDLGVANRASGLNDGGGAGLGNGL